MTIDQKLALAHVEIAAPRLRACERKNPGTFLGKRQHAIFAVRDICKTVRRVIGGIEYEHSAIGIGKYALEHQFTRSLSCTQTPCSGNGKRTRGAEGAVESSVFERSRLGRVATDHKGVVHLIGILPGEALSRDLISV